MAQSSLEAKRRYRDRNREKIRVWNRDYAARKRREAGQPALGTPESVENRRRARKATGVEHGNWKGDEVGYFALHEWLKRHKTRTGICSECGDEPEPAKGRRVGTEWANVSGEYRRSTADFVELCVPCHRRRDRRGLIHGTATGYGYYRCRCDECRKANAVRKREYNKRVRGGGDLSRSV